MRTMILLSAIPGSGKSTWARAYQANHANTFIVSSDEIRKELFGSAQDFRNEQLVWKTYLNRLNNYAATMSDVNVIADATNLQNKYRKMYHDETPHFEKHILVYFDIPYDICLIQNKMREHERVVPDRAMESLKAELELPSKEIISLYDEYVIVKDFSTTAKQIEDSKR